MAQVLKFDFTLNYPHEVLLVKQGKTLLDEKYKAGQVAQEIIANITDNTGQVRINVTNELDGDIRYIQYSLGMALDDSGINIPYHIG